MLETAAGVIASAGELQRMHSSTMEDSKIPCLNLMDLDIFRTFILQHSIHTGVTVPAEGPFWYDIYP